MINSLYSSIINYKAIYKPISIENSIQLKTNWKDGEIFFTNQQYRKNRPMRRQYRDKALLSHLLY